MTRSELKKLVKKGREGILTRKEAEQLASDFTEKSQVYLRIYGLGLSMFPEFIPVLEKFVFYEDDLDVASEALRFLLIHHHRKEYLPLLIECVKGVKWDLDNSLRLEALHTAREFLRESFDRELLRLVIHTFEKDRNSIIREAAYVAILGAAKFSGSEIPYGSEGINPSEFRYDIVEKLKEKLVQ